MSRVACAHGGRSVNRIAILLLGSVLAVAIATADEAPISGAVKSVDPAGQTVTVRQKTASILPFPCFHL